MSGNAVAYGAKWRRARGCLRASCNQVEKPIMMQYLKIAAVAVVAIIIAKKIPGVQDYL